MSASDRPVRERFADVDSMLVRFGRSSDPVRPSTLTECGLARFGDAASSGTVAAILTNDRPSVELVLGAIAAGVRLASLPLPPRGRGSDAYVEQLRASLALVGADRVVCSDDVAALLGTVGVEAMSHSQATAPGAAPLAAPGSHCSLVQFTSGSTGAPRGIVVDEAALDANLAAILDRVAPGDREVAVTWLPLSHDMGLIGMLLASLAAGRAGGTSGELVILEPREFLRDPRTWTSAVSELGGTFSAAPDFGLRLATRRGPAPGSTMSSMRCLIVGGEIVRPSTLRSFAAAFDCAPQAVCPAYGMAEVGLAVTIDEPGRPWRSVTMSAEAAVSGTRAAPSSAGDEFELALCGAPLGGYDVGVDAPSGEIGPLMISGPSLARDAVTGERLASPGPDGPGALVSGDLGFLDGVELGVIGRADDVLVVHGRRVHAPQLEARLGDLPGVRPGRAAAIVRPDGRLVVLVEPDSGDRVPDTDLVRRCAVASVGATPDRVVVLERGALPLTPSGKLRRGELLPLTTGDA